MNDWTIIQTNPKNYTWEVDNSKQHSDLQSMFCNQYDVNNSDELLITHECVFTNAIDVNIYF